MFDPRFKPRDTLGRQVASARAGVCDHLIVGAAHRELTLELFALPGGLQPLHPNPYLFSPDMAAGIAANWLRCAVYLGPAAVGVFADALREAKNDMRQFAAQLKEGRS